MKKINSILIFLVFLSLKSIGQQKDVFFILDDSNSEYIFFTDKKTLDEFNLEKISLISILYRDKYENYESDLKDYKQKLKELGRNPTLEEHKKRPRLQNWTFKIESQKRIQFKNQELAELNLVDFEWLQMNSWKENNPNILFKDLYFIYKIESNSYVEFKVERTLIIE